MSVSPSSASAASSASVSGSLTSGVWAGKRGGGGKLFLGGGGGGAASPVAPEAANYGVQACQRLNCDEQAGTNR